MTDVWDSVRDHLRDRGIDINVLVNEEGNTDGVKMVCVCGDLSDSVQELGRTSRDQVVMVRIDEETRERLDAWIETGAVKSRSEAAALFIQEGLKVRSAELTELDEALQAVEDAKQVLRERAREVIGDESDD